MAASSVRTIDHVLIDQVVKRIVEACTPESVTVFGSAARGETTEGSDLDVVVVLDLPEGASTRDMSRNLHALFDGWLLPLDIIVLSKEEWLKGVRLPGHIARTAVREGVRVYG
jgi:uncharacterized protein